MHLLVSFATLVLTVTPVATLKAQLNTDTDFFRTSPAAQGTIRQYVIDPRGDVQGLFLSDGAQVVFTSRVQRDVIATMKPDTPIRIEGSPSTLPLVEPDTMVNMDSGAAINVPSLLEGPFPQANEALVVQQMHGEGAIDRLSYKRSGRVSGLVLHNETQIWLPPDINDQFRRSFTGGRQYHGGRKWHRKRIWPCNGPSRWAYEIGR